MNSSRLGDKDAIQVPGTMGATSKKIAGFRQIWILVFDRGHQSQNGGRRRPSLLSPFELCTWGINIYLL
jgi:hypothetical protein